MAERSWGAPGFLPEELPREVGAGMAGCSFVPPAAPEGPARPPLLHRPRPGRAPAGAAHPFTPFALSSSLPFLQCWRTWWRSVSQQGVQDLEEKHPLLVRSGDDPRLGVAQPHGAVAA